MKDMGAVMGAGHGDAGGPRRGPRALRTRPHQAAMKAAGQGIGGCEAASGSRADQATDGTVSSDHGIAVPRKTLRP